MEADDYCCPHPALQGMTCQPERLQNGSVYSRLTHSVLEPNPPDFSGLLGSSAQEWQDPAGACAKLCTGGGALT